MLGPEQLASQSGSQVLYGIDIVATGIKAVVGIPFGVLVRQQVAHGQLAGKAAVVLAGDEFEVGALVGQLVDDPTCHKGGDL